MSPLFAISAQRLFFPVCSGTTNNGIQLCEICKDFHSVSNYKQVEPKRRYLTLSVYGHNGQFSIFIIAAVFPPESNVMDETDVLGMDFAAIC